MRPSRGRFWHGRAETIGKQGSDCEHKAWLTVEVDTKQEALRILPPAFRARARVVQLSKFSVTHFGDMLRAHLGDTAGIAAAAARA